MEKLHASIGSGVGRRGIAQSRCQGTWCEWFRRSVAWVGEPWLTAAIPTDNTYCSCKGREGGWVMAYSCLPYG